MKIIDNKLNLFVTDTSLANLPLDDDEDKRMYNLIFSSWDVKNLTKKINELMINSDICRIYSNNGSVKIITDRFGRLPIYYYKDEKNLCIFTNFSTFFNTNFEKKLEVDSTGVWEASLFDIFLGSRTIFKNVKLIPTGSICTFDAHNNLSIEKYFNYDFPKSMTFNEEEVVEAVIESLSSSLLKTNSDHFLLPLSGGIDSRLLAAILTKLFNPNKITAISFAAHPSSYEFRYAKRTCDILNIKDWRPILLTPDSYLRSLEVFPNRCGGNLSIAHGHLFDTIRQNSEEFSFMTLVSGAFADAAGGYGAKNISFREERSNDSNYYKYFEKFDKELSLTEHRDLILHEFEMNFDEWKQGCSIETFDEYLYVKTRQPRVLFTQSLLYTDILPVFQPFADSKVADLLFALPFEFRQYKKAFRLAIKQINPKLFELRDISSKMVNENFSDLLHIYRGKILNNTARLMTEACSDKILFFSPYQTENQDYNLRTCHRKLIIDSLDILREFKVINSQQQKILSQKPYKQFGGGVLTTFQYWSITIADTIKKYCN